jgi:hypothetical protein
MESIEKKIEFQSRLFVIFLPQILVASCYGLALYLLPGAAPQRGADRSPDRGYVWVRVRGKKDIAGNRRATMESGHVRPMRGSHKNV